MCERKGADRERGPFERVGRRAAGGAWLGADQRAERDELAGLAPQPLVAQLGIAQALTLEVHYIQHRMGGCPRVLQRYRFAATDAIVVLRRVFHGDLFVRAGGAARYYLPFLIS